mmetsp:Transcript_6917/g.8350  ORF Transcript_6917/g.8350 Transcript_6917/m.8350 type:complete len:261 (+) Transcript_6917:47-829(+)
MDPIMLPDVKAVNTNVKLTQVLNEFDPFDERMLEGTRARLLKDKSKVDEMTRETDRLTKALAAQVTVRRDMNQQLQRLCENHLKKVYEEFDELVANKKSRVEQRLDALDERITELDEHFTNEKIRIKLEIEERHNELMEMLKKFRQLFTKECAVRTERETAIKKDMSLHDKDVENRFRTEADARGSIISRLRSELSDNIASRRTSDIQFAAFVDSELSEVKSSLNKVSTVREDEDDKIEDMFSDYTRKLQSSLHVVNSID